METVMAELRNWYMATQDGKLTAHGDVYFSDKIEDGRLIQTTAVQEITYLSDRLEVRTQNSVYELPYAYHRLVEGIDTNVIPVEYLQGKQEILDISRWTEGAVDERREKEKQEMSRVIEEEDKDAVVLRFSSHAAYYYLAMLVKHGDEISYSDTYKVQPGTYDDSVLIPDTLFACHPGFETMTFYSWDEGIGTVYLENAGEDAISFVTPHGTHRAEAHECLKFKR